MAKSAKGKTKETISAKKKKHSHKTPGARTKAAEHVNCLLELHKLQGVLLNQLHKEV